jgi:hypothetical protein
MSDLKTRSRNHSRIPFLKNESYENGYPFYVPLYEEYYLKHKDSQNISLSLSGQSKKEFLLDNDQFFKNIID